MTSQKSQKNLKRKLNRRNSFEDSEGNGEQNSVNSDVHNISDAAVNVSDNDTETASIRPFWNKYCQVYDKLAESVSKVQTTEECIVTTRIVDITSAKLAQEIQKLDLEAIDHWVTISSHLVRNWDKFFFVPENDGWSFSQLIPLNRFKTNYFGYFGNILEKRKGTGESQVLNAKKRRTRKDDERAKLSKPLEGKSDDKPLPLIEHMKRMASAIERNCVNGNRSVEYLRLVIDPKSYSSTVYNIFTISFLIREGMVSLNTGKNKELRISLRPESDYKKNKDNEERKSHFITCLTTSEWKELIKALGITSAMVRCPNSVTEDHRFYEKFSQSQKERVKRKKP